MNRDLDDFDRKILAALQLNGRMPIQELSERVGLSPTPCKRRLKLLEENGVILGYSAVVDPKACGFAISLYVFVKLENRNRDNIGRFEEAIRRMDHVLNCQLITGTYDYLLTIHLPDMSDYEVVLRQELADVPAVSEIQTSVVIGNVKAKRDFVFGSSV